MPSHFAGTQRAIHSNMILALLRSEEKEETEQACFSFYYYFFFMRQWGGEGRWDLNHKHRAPQRMPLPLDY